MVDLHDIPYFEISREEQTTVNDSVYNGLTAEVNESYYGRMAKETCIKLISQSCNGEKHHTLVKASYLLGGYIAGGLVNEEEARNILRHAIAQKEDVRNLHDAYKTISA